MRNPINRPARAAAVAAVLLAVSACTHASTGAGGPGSPAGGEPAAASQPPTGPDEDAVSLLPAAARSKGVLTVASDASYRPFEYFDTDNRTMIGFDVDLTDALGAKLGLKVRHVNAGFDSILPGLAAGKYDLGASSFSVTPERSRTVDFVPYLDGGSSIAVAKGNPKKLSMDPDLLCGLTVSAQKGSVQGLEQLPAISEECRAAGDRPVGIELFPSQDGANLAVVSGRADAVMADTVSLNLQAEASGGQFELAPGDDYAPTPTGLALVKGSPLKPALDAAMASALTDGTVKKLMDKWHIPASAMLRTES